MAASSLLRSLTRRGCAGPGAFAYRHQQQQPWSPFSTTAAAAAAGTRDEAAKGFPGLKGYDVVCVAPRNHMVFTPLLASTCVGTLEFRSVAEPVVRIQPAVSKSPGSYFLLARCIGVDPDGHTVRSPPPPRLGVTVRVDDATNCCCFHTCVCWSQCSQILGEMLKGHLC